MLIVTHPDDGRYFYLYMYSYKYANITVISSQVSKYNEKILIKYNSNTDNG